MQETRREKIQQADYPIRPVPFTAVHLDDQFWAPRIERNRTQTVPFAFQQCEDSGRFDLFRRAAAALRGEDVDKTPPGYPFDDSDVYKVLEGAAYTLSVQPDPALEAYVDGVVALIGTAQEPDGYLYTTRTISPESPHRYAGKERWVGERAHSHELYNLGHLYEAAVAYEQATSKRELLDIAIKSADLLVRTFGPDKQEIWPGHQITEMALVKLYRATGNRNYLDLAKFLLDTRRPDGWEGAGLEYNQSHACVVDQAEAVGHAVRATYMYAGMADVAAVAGDRGYVEAIDRIWEDVVAHKLYIIGGIGSTHEGEAFGPAYDLPNASAYCETCAAIGNIFWNGRLFLLHGDGKYIDVLERTLYNGFLSGVSLDGMRFFYENPLESDGNYERSPWFGCACCPSNVARFLPSLPGYVYAQDGGTLYVNLFIAGSSTVTLEDGRVIGLTQETLYPWDGDLLLRVTPAQPSTFAIKLRIPGWARDEAVPSDLYRFIDGAAEAPTLRVNGGPVALNLDRGYVTIEREWQAGDEISLHLPTPVRRVVAHDAVEADRGRVALQRGPLVYCAEWPDNDVASVRDLALADSTSIETEFRPDLLDGVAVLTGSATDSDSACDFTAIPYYAWANRGKGEMIVWLARQQSE